MDFIELARANVVYIAVIVAVIGLTICLVGYRLSRFSLGMVGFFIGSFLGGHLTKYLSENYGMSSVLPQNIPWIMLVVGITVATLFAVYELAGLFGIGLASGIFIGVFLLPPQFFVYSVILGVLLGLAAVFLEKVIVVPLTAYTGAVFFALSLYIAAQKLDPIDSLLNPIPYLKTLVSDMYVALLVFFIGLMGILTQTALIRSKKKEES